MLYQGAEVTRSLSNLIKYPFVNMQGKETVVIDNNSEGAEFVPFRDKGVKIKTISEIEAEKALLRAVGASSGETAVASEDAEKKDGSGEFKAGLNVTNFDELFQQHQKEAEDKAAQVVEEARKQAERIRSEAEIAAETARKRAYEDGREQGYSEGMALAEQEIQQKEEELSQLARQQREELADCMEQIEEKYVSIVISLVKKLTGVVMEGKDDIILYLIHTAAQDLEVSENYRIRVSSEDIYFLESRKEEVLQALDGEAFVEFVEEKGLEKGQCIIETDTQMVDCGFHTQLDSLVQNLKMLVH